MSYRSLCVLLLSAVVSVFSQTDPARLAAWTITADDCRQRVTTLADGRFGGRGTGDFEFIAAARYIAAEFQRAGLKPLDADSSYFQRFAVDRNRIAANPFLELLTPIASPVGSDTLRMPLRLQDDFLPAASSAPCTLNAPLVFAGYGIRSPEHGWDDLADIDLQGAVALVLDGTPLLPDAHFDRSFRGRRKLRFLADAGARAALLVGEPIGGISSRQSVPAATISAAAADLLLAGSGWTLAALRDSMQQRPRKVSMALPHRVHLQIASELAAEQQTMNIVGYLPGSDPKLRHEAIVIGAHADHIGQIGDAVFTGANDNASGTAVVMELAEAFVALPQAPKRSIVFMAFTGEEMGLLGSRFAVENPLWPVAQTRVMINLDMVGSGTDGMMIVGGNNYPELLDLFRRASAAHEQVPVLDRWTAANSDHFPFHEKGIPAIFIYALGGVSTYHTPRDRPETLDAEVMERIGRLTFQVVLDLANRNKVDLEMIPNPQP